MKNFKNLKRGDIIRHRMSSSSYIVSGNYGEYVIGVKTIHMSNPEEWIKVEKENE